MAPRELTDDEVFGPSAGVPGKVWAAAERHGVDPNLALNVARQESRFNPAAVSPKGAIGVMQLMPATAADLGADPRDVDQNIDAGVRYLGQQVQAFGGDQRLGAAAYNAGPGRVRRAGGVPNIPETQAYVDAVAPQAELSDADVFGTQAPTQAEAAAAPATKARGPLGGPATPTAVINPETGKPYNDAQEATYGALIRSGKLDPNATPGSQAFPRGLAHPKDQPKPGDWYVDLDGQVKQAPGLAADVGQGFLSGAAKAGGSLMDTVMQAGPVGQIPQMLEAAASLAQGHLPQNRPFSGGSQAVAASRYAPLSTAGRYAETAGEMLPNAIAPGGIPRKIAAVALPAIGSQAAGDTAQALGANPTVTAAARFLGGTAGALGSGLGVVRGAAAPKAASVQELRDASDKAWKAVDASGYRFPQDKVQAAADDIKGIVEEAGPELYENSAKVANRVTQLAARGELTPAQANRLRSQIGEKLLRPGSDEASVGKLIQQRIDQLIDGAAADSKQLADARTKYTRYLKVKDVTDRLEDAGVNQASSGTGGNMNAARQALKPLVKNKSNQRMRNASPAEMAALKQVVNGTPTQNLLRAASAFDPFHSRLGALLQGGLGIKTGGLSAATIPLGIAATAGERAMAQRNIDNLLATLSTGATSAGPKLTLQPTDPLAPFSLGVLLGVNQPAPSLQPAPRR